MRPHLVKNKILLDIIKKNNQQRKIFLLEKNTYFFNFVLFSIILFGLLFLVYKYIDKTQKHQLKQKKEKESLRKKIYSSSMLNNSKQTTSSPINSNNSHQLSSNMQTPIIVTPKITEQDKEINDLISSYSQLLENSTK
jgi:heme/copper-type cytochrome/quinol oxidase subunit 3